LPSSKIKVHSVDPTGSKFKLDWKSQIILFFVVVKN